MGGHISIGPITIFGSNAMAWAVNIRSKKYGYICFTLPSIHFLRKKQGHYLYLSPNATPWAATFYRGRDKDNVLKAAIRKHMFGHGFSTDDRHDKLWFINNYIPSIVEYHKEYGFAPKDDD